MIEWKLHAPSTFQVAFYFNLFFPEFDSTLNVNSWNGSISNGEDPEYFHIYVGMPELSSLKYWKQFHIYVGMLKVMLLLVEKWTHQANPDDLKRRVAT